jgi:peroxiredoxin
METYPETLPLGSRAPEFELPGVDGKSYRLEAIRSPIFIYVQSSNLCPVVQAYLGRLNALAEEYADRVRFVMVNANDGEQESLEPMQRFAAEHALTFPYLKDETQEVARAYRTVRTPEVLVFDRQRKLAYHGRIDDNKDEAKVTKRELHEALEAILAGRPVSEPETYAVGCTVKWKPGNEPVVGG